MHANPSPARHSLLRSTAVFATLAVGWLTAAAAEPARLVVQADRPGVKISPVLYGLMTEEINYSYDGGLYAELIRNRVFKDGATETPHWSIVTAKGAAATMALDHSQPVENTALTDCLRVEIQAAADGKRAGVANDGYWGIPVQPHTKYRASFYAKSDGAIGPLTLDIESNDGAKIFAQAQVAAPTGDWQKYTAELTTGDAAPSTTNRFVVTAARPGKLWLTQVSLFPPTYKDRPNGNRIDLMEKLAAMKPAFLRFPGGNYLEGDTIAERFDWKKTLGDISQRPGHQGPWRYRSTDGLGLLEFLEWCEDLHIEPLLAVFAGYALHHEYVTGDQLQPFVQDALDEIEYVTGDPGTTWGARRAADGHPAPFELHWVEVGNEDNFDKSGSYDDRFAAFFDAIKARYPKLSLIATTRVRSRVPDFYDQHFYPAAEKMEKDSHRYDSYSRTGPKVFVGEWASQDAAGASAANGTKGPTPSMLSALGDAAWMIGLERNSDIVLMQCYAPLLVNLNPGGRQWPVNLIGYDALHSFGSPSYHAQAMFARNRGDVVLPAVLSGADGEPMICGASRDEATGDIILKAVNTTGQPFPLQIDFQGVSSIAPEAAGEVIAGPPGERNTLEAPARIAPQPVAIHGAAPSFVHEFPPDSVTVLRFRAK